MTRIIIRKLIFNAYNREHIKKHKVSEAEIIAAGKNLIYHRRTYKSRYLAIGRTGNKLVTLIIEKKGLSTYYIVTARASSKKERRNVYEKEKK
ncbi:hypothetical protein HZB96_01540 [Candidatus Gottesmanbacteria bacterium]|nr:hypothetical protein [Candidatus Gottesmanbacteria bacterium]